MTAKVPDAQVIGDVVMLACHAPSLHNSQPWRWVAQGATLQLWADPHRLVYATDQAGRELAGMATCTLTHMTELAPSRDIIRQVTGNAGQPQLLIRVGKSPAMDPHVGGTARRPLTEVLEIRW